MVRKLQISHDKEQISTTDLFNVFLQNARFTVTISFVPISPGSHASTKKAFNFSKSVGNNHNTPKQVSQNPKNQTKVTTLRTGSAVNNGTYIAHILIQYKTHGSLNHTNQWVDSSKTASAHTITFQSI